MEKAFLKYLSFFTFSIFISVNLFGQGKTVIRGQVKDKNTNEPIPGVNVIEKNDNNRSLNGTITDANGYYMIGISGDEKTELMFSFISYKSKTIAISGQKEINVQLEEDVQQIGDITVKADRMTSTGIESIMKRDMTGSVSRIDMKTFEGLPATSVSEVLQGRATGVMATSFSGDPGSGMQIRIRGESSISASNNPLYVIDGMPVISENNNSLSALESNPLSDIPPEEIESIEVLKDASAVALWGTRAANGVVIINTKRGDRNKTTVGITTRLTLKVPRPNIPMLDGNGYKTLMNEADQNRGNDKYNLEVVTNLRDNLDNPFYELHNNNTNWIDAIENNGFIQYYNFNLSGGGNSVRYRFSTTLESDKGPVINTAYQRFNTSFNLDYDISNSFSISSNISFTNSETDKKDLSDEDNKIPDSVQGAALTRAPTWPIYLQDRLGNSLDGQYAFQELLVDNDFTLTNPYAYILNKISQNKSNRLLGKVQATLRPVKGLLMSVDLGGDLSANKDFYFIPPTATGAEPGDPGLRFNKMRLIDSELFKLYGRATANYVINVKDVHQINATLFGSVDMTTSSNVSSGGNNIASFRTPTLSTAASYAGNKPLTSNQNNSNLTSIGMRVQYKLHDRYIIGGSMSRDGSSKFGPENRYAYLPTASARWRLSHEWFLRDVDFLDDLSLRFSWGKTGNGNISDYTYYSRYGSSIENSYLGIGGVQASNIRLDNIRWETTSQQNYSISSEMYDNRLKIEMAYYEKFTSDLLRRDNSIPTSSGYSSLRYFNSGDIRNNGFELELNYDILAKSKTRWTFGVVVSTLKNQIVKLPKNSITEGKDNGAGGYYWRLVEGDPLGSFYGYNFLGVYAYDQDAIVKDSDGNAVYNLGGYDPAKEFNNAKIMKYSSFQFEGGDAIYEDVNKDGLIDQQDILKIGDVNPDIFGGANTTFAYLDFSVSLFFNYSFGNDVINVARMDVENMSTLNNQSIATLRRWRTQGDVTEIPKAAHQYKSGVNYLPSTRFIEDGSYFRIKSLQCSYSIPRKYLKEVKISNARVFFNITNLYTWTNYLGQDPEVNGKGEILRGVDKSLTAQPVMYTFGITINF